MQATNHQDWVKAMIDTILNERLINPHSGYDVDADDILAYRDECELNGEVMSVSGFKQWLDA